MNEPDFQIDPSEFSGKRVIVTGGTKGAGEAIVNRMVRAGAEVITAARSAPDTDSPARFIAADLSTSDGVEAWCGIRHRRRHHTCDLKHLSEH